VWAGFAHLFATIVIHIKNSIISYTINKSISIQENCL